MWLQVILLAVLSLVLGLHMAIQIWEKKTGRRLPGPPCLPIIGSLPFIIPYVLSGKHNYEMCRDVARKYGSVFGVQIGLFYHVVVEDLHIAKEIMSSLDWKQRCCNHPVFFERSFHQPYGVLMGTDARGQGEVRKYTMKILRKFGISRSDEFQASLHEEASLLLNRLGQSITPSIGFGVVDMQHFFHIPSLNILWKIMTGVRFCPDDNELKRLLEVINDVSKAAVIGMTPMFAFPALRFIPHVTEHDQLLRTHQKVQALYAEIIKTRRSEGCYRENPQNFIEAFLQQIDMRQDESGGQDVVYTDQQLVTVGMDLFMTGSDTTSTALEFSILYMMRNPKVQAKVQEELDRVIGRDRLPGLADKPMLPYTEATIYELMRYTSLVPIAIRCALREGLTIKGVPIKKETMVGLNLQSIHFSKELWDDPYVFRPERFLNENMEVVNTHKIIPFGFGTRGCVGEWLAKSTFFTFYTACMQKFSFEMVPWLPEPSYKTYSGIAQYPVQFFAKITNRS